MVIAAGATTSRAICSSALLEHLLRGLAGERDARVDVVAVDSRAEDVLQRRLAYDGDRPRVGQAQRQATHRECEVSGRVSARLQCRVDDDCPRGPCVKRWWLATTGIAGRDGDVGSHDASRFGGTAEPDLDHRPARGRQEAEAFDVGPRAAGRSEPGGNAEAEGRGDEQRRGAAGSPANAEGAPGSAASRPGAPVGFVLRRPRGVPPCAGRPRSGHLPRRRDGRAADGLTSSWSSRRRLIRAPPATHAALASSST